MFYLCVYVIVLFVCFVCLFVLLCLFFVVVFGFVLVRVLLFDQTSEYNFSISD